MYVDKVRVKFIRPFEWCPVWIVTSQCGRFNWTFDNAASAVHCATLEYQSRVEQEQWTERLKDW